MYEKKNAVANRATNIVIALAVLTTAILLTGCSNARGRVVSVEADHDVRLVDGEPDYGITLTVTVANVGESGPIRITPMLSCSEGEWDRTQNLHFDAGEKKTLSYFFHEPTINATGIHYGVSVFPKASP